MMSAVKIVGLDGVCAGAEEVLGATIGSQIIVATTVLGDLDVEKGDPNFLEFLDQHIRHFKIGIIVWYLYSPSPCNG